MATRHLIRIAALAATLFAAAACIYPYHVEFGDSDIRPIVVEGDILLGGTATLNLSYVRPFGESSDDVSVLATARIEGEDGTQVAGTGENGVSGKPATGPWTFDTANLPETQRYRLHIETFTQAGNASQVFESDWLTPSPAPTIDDLAYAHHPEVDELWIGLSMHCHGSHYFRWTFTETWEYHSDVNTWLEYFPLTRSIDWYKDTNMYFCWNDVENGKINLFSTVNQTDDRFEELAFHTIPLTDLRLQVLYRMRLRLEALSEDAYSYWNNVRQNSEEQGSIFSPTPSEMTGNIHCISDPSVQVIGYLNAAVPADAELYYDNWEEKLYHTALPLTFPSYKVSANRRDSMALMYSSFFLPYEEVYEGIGLSPSHYMWGPSRCIDCRELGGTKDRPEDWPNDHY